MEELGFKEGFKVKNLLRSWSFIKERKDSEGFKLTFCKKNTNENCVFFGFQLDRIPEALLKKDAIRYYTYKSEGLVITN